MDISIIGAGIAGLCAAIALQKEGYEVKVYEGAQTIKPLGAGLALSANAMKALEIIGLSEEVMKKGKVLGKLSILDETGKPISVRNTQSFSSQFRVDNFTIHRADLHQILLSKLKPGSLFLNYRIKDFRGEGRNITMTFHNGEIMETGCLIAADGVHSVIRKSLLPNSSPRYSGYTCWRSVVEREPNGFDNAVFSETWGGKGRFGVVPLNKGRVYWYACLNAPFNDPDMGKYRTKELLEIFKEFHFPIPQIISSTTDEDLIHGDIIDIKPIPHYAFDNILLIGDAAHATTPNMGQGACQAIEDALFLTNCLKKYQNPVVAFQKFENIRKQRTHKIVNTSWTLGKIAQWENSLMCKARNSLLRIIPDSFNQKQLEFLYNVDFGKV